MSEALVTEIIEGIGDVKGCEPTDIDFALNDYIEPDAIESLASHEAENWVLTFEVPELTVTVRGDGVVAVERTAQKPSL